ncbi:hypothetical protein O6P43_017105 [Quillaja saponaria]|uniref:Uncharacterized protein n=1 Tax=Quillaja saponaria TaxID=32244 RepID=A0AAD7PP05_QUISA|nr:hypothetical protein O6P43_017105 [Quillaja saponaria]
MKKMWRASKALGSMVYGTIVGDPTTVVAAAISSLLDTEKESQAEKKTYNVFLSFRGADTCSAFTGSSLRRSIQCRNHHLHRRRGAPERR